MPTGNVCRSGTDWYGEPCNTTYCYIGGHHFSLTSVTDGVSALLHFDEYGDITVNTSGYGENSQITLQLQPEPGYGYFCAGGENSDCRLPDGTCRWVSSVGTITLKGTTYNVTIGVVQGQGGVDVYKNNDWIGSVLGAQQTFTYNSGDYFKAVAVPASGYVFEKLCSTGSATDCYTWNPWEGTITGPLGADYYFKTSGTSTCTRTVSVAQGQGGINVYKNGSPIGSNITTPQTFTFNTGDTVKYEAVPASGYTYDKWCDQNNYCWVGNPWNYTIDCSGGNKDIKAYFISGTSETHLGCSGGTCQTINGGGGNTDGCTSAGQTCGSSGGQPITLTNPTNGASWIAGQTYNITWTSSGITGLIAINLFKNGVWTSTINWVSNTGSYSWAIPTTLSTGSDYHIKLESVDDTTKWNWDDWSTKRFTITSGGTNGPCGQPTCYKCSGTSCINDNANGTYTTCSPNPCTTNGPCGQPTCYKCNGTNCESDNVNGTYTTCTPNPCTSGGTYYKCENGTCNTKTGTGTSDCNNPGGTCGSGGGSTGTNCLKLGDSCIPYIYIVIGIGALILLKK